MLNFFVYLNLWFLFAAFEAANFQIDFFGNSVMRTAQWDSTVWRKTFRLFGHTLLDTWLFINTRIIALNSRIKRKTFNKWETILLAFIWDPFT